MKFITSLTFAFFVFFGMTASSHAEEQMACLLGVNCDEVFIQTELNSECAEINRLVCQIKKISKKVEDRKNRKLKNLKRRLVFIQKQQSF